MPRHFKFLFIIFALFSTASLAQPPVATERETTDVYFGNKVIDQYRWLENLKSDKTQKWIKGQVGYARHFGAENKNLNLFVEKLCISN